MSTTPGGLVSLVLASRNGARFLPEALRSIAAQDRPALELLLVDDGSSDDTPRLLDAFAREHAGARVLRAGGVGPAAARDLAAREAAGTFIAIHDDDDRSAPGRLRRQAEFLEAHPDVGIVGSATQVIDARGEVVGREVPPPDDAALRRRLRRAPPFAHGSVMIRADAYRRAGGYRAAFRVAEDYDLYLRLADHARLACLPEPLYAWRRHDANTFARQRDLHLFYAAAARTFAWERAARGADAVEALGRAADPAAFMATYAHAPRLARFWGESLVREGRVAEARRVLARALAEPSLAPGALAWWALSWPVALSGRARAARSPGGAS